MIHIPIIVAGVAIRAACKHMQDQDRKKKANTTTDLRWTGSITVARPLPSVRASIGDYLLVRGFSLHNRRGGIQFYRRGDLSISRLPCQRDVQWAEIPVLLGVGFSTHKGVAVVSMSMSGWPSTKFDESVSNFFAEHAEMELDGAVEFLNQGMETPRSEPPPPPPRDTSLDDDLTLLDLTRGFSWEQLQSAYRSACRKYHPDRLVGVEPDVVKLAERHFTQITAAYQRLRVRVPQPQAS